MPQSIQPAFAEVNGTHLYYETAGSGEAVVFLHGFTLDTRMWDDQFLPLAQRFKVVRYDLRGFGRSTVPTEAMYSHAEDLNSLLEHLKIPQAHLVGLSMGGAVALDFALIYPTRVLSLVLIDTVLGGYPWSQEGSARDRLVWQRARETGIAGAKESWLSHPLFAPAQRQPQVAARLAQIVADYSGWHFIHHNPAVSLEPPAAERLTELRMPVLALVGEKDLPDFRACTDVIARQVPNAQLHQVAGVGHMANMEAPQQVTRSILEFLIGL